MSKGLGVDQTKGTGGQKAEGNPYKRGPEGRWVESRAGREQSR